MAIICSKIVNYVSESVNYLTYQSPIYVSITFIYIIHFIHASRFSKYWDFFFFLSSPGTIKWISGSIVD